MKIENRRLCYGQRRVSHSPCFDNKINIIIIASQVGKI